MSPRSGRRSAEFAELDRMNGIYRIKNLPESCSSRKSCLELDIRSQRRIRGVDPALAGRRPYQAH